MNARKTTPVLLTKIEAMEFAADQLVGMAHDLKMAGIVLDAMGKGDCPSAELIASLAKARREIPEPGLQAEACRQAARAIRDQAMEERLVAARADAAQANRVVSGGGGMADRPAARSLSEGADD